MVLRLTRIGLLLSLSLLVPSFSAVAWGVEGDPTVALEANRLFLQAGNIDTKELPNALYDRVSEFQPGKAYVIQFEGPMTTERKQALARAGIALRSYLPTHAYLAELGGLRKDQLAALDFVTWVGEYRDEWKLDPTIGNRLQPFQTDERIQLAEQGLLKIGIFLFEWADVEAAKKDLVTAGVTVTGSELQDQQTLLFATMPAANLGTLATKDYVQFVEEAPEITMRNNTTRWIVQSNTTNVTPLYDAGIHGEGQVVGIIDLNVYTSHCSFTDSVPIGPLHRKILAYNVALGSQDHGTHVAGTAVGDGGVQSDTRGIAYLGKMVYNTVPSFTEAGITQRLNLHHSQGARMHTNSWGNDGTTSYDGLCRGIDVFSRNNEDDLVFFAVTNLSTLKNPENAKNLVAVGASQDTPSQANHCSGGAGTTSDQRRKPEIYAPGCNTLSSRWSTVCSTIGFTGTSMASPAVTGVGMLVRQYFMDGYYPRGEVHVEDAFTPSGALVKAVLLNSGVDMTGISGYPSNSEGWGRLLIGDSVYLNGDTRKLKVLDDVRNANGFATSGDFETYTVSILNSSQKLKVTLVFTDVAATAGASTAAINNLDLEVTSPSATLYFGNVFSGGLSATGGVRDIRNNVEQVHLNNPEVGVWTIRVAATAINQSTQGYAVVVTADLDQQLGPSCTDGEQNQGEDLIDCGGPCPACECLVVGDCDDGVFCNGAETCDSFGQCVPGTAPCVPPLPICNENTDTCGECLDDLGCDDDNRCTSDLCNLSNNLCEHPPFQILYADIVV
ncbi:MAG: S8 family serine peptidase, partial [Planctomycetota bacterium]